MTRFRSSFHEYLSKPTIAMIAGTPYGKSSPKAVHCYLRPSAQIHAVSVNKRIGLVHIACSWAASASAPRGPSRLFLAARRRATNAGQSSVATSLLVVGNPNNNGAGRRIISKAAFPIPKLAVLGLAERVETEAAKRPTLSRSALGTGMAAHSPHLLRLQGL